MAKISEKIKEYIDKNNEKMVEQFSFLQRMAQSKCEVYKYEIKEMFGNEQLKEIPIVGKSALRYYCESYVDITSGNEEEVINDICSHFNPKECVMNEFINVVTYALKKINKQSTIGEYKDEIVLIFPDNNSIARVDIKIYKYSFLTDGFIQQCQNVFCYTLSKSVVDIAKIKKDEIMGFLSQMCKDILAEKGIEGINNLMNEVMRALSLYNI